VSQPASGWARLSPLMVLVHPVRLLVRLLPAVLLVLLVGSVVSVPYVKWRRRRHGATAAGVRA